MTIYYNTETKKYYKVVNVFCGTVKVKQEDSELPEQAMSHDKFLEQESKQIFQIQNQEQ